MAITTEQRRLSLAALVSFALIAFVGSLADFSLPNIALFNPFWIAVLLLSHLLMVAGRGLLMLILAPVELRSHIASWIRLAARHQMIFSVFPSGLGDLSFPILAKRIVSVPTGHALRIMMLVRLRDIITLGSIAACGALFMLSKWETAFFFALAGAVALWFVDDLASMAARSLARLLRRGRIHDWIKVVAEGEPTTFRQRTLSAGISILVWSASVSAVLAVFRAIGEPLSLTDALIFIAMVNAAGVIAISIAGLGVSEAGATGALVLAGRSVQAAASTALIVRPALLLSMLVSCLCLEFLIQLLRRGRVIES